MKVINLLLLILCIGTLSLPLHGMEFHYKSTRHTHKPLNKQEEPSTAALYRILEDTEEEEPTSFHQDTTIYDDADALWFALHPSSQISGKKRERETAEANDLQEDYLPSKEERPASAPLSYIEPTPTVLPRCASETQIVQILSQFKKGNKKLTRESRAMCGRVPALLALSRRRFYDATPKFPTMPSRPQTPTGPVIFLSAGEKVKQIKFTDETPEHKKS